jgi:HK97 family phage portal protein
VSLFRRQQRATTAAEYIPSRGAVAPTSITVTNDTALRHSAVWACLRTRANLISTLPVDQYRRVGGIQVEVPKQKILVTPGGDRVDICEWLYSTQIDLDRSGNAFGLITERDGFNFPSRIDLVPLSAVAVRVRAGEIVNYRIDGKDFSPDNVWHEKQYTIGGFPLGLSPVAYAAWSIGEYLSVQDFALDWFSNSTVPAGHLKNTARTLSESQAARHKETFLSNVKSGQPWVTGSDWDYQPLQAANQTTSWIEAKQYSVSDIARFFDVPGDLIDAVISGGTKITYANITQRNLQFLILHLAPAIIRREAALTRIVPQPRYIKFNTNALLRMDPMTQAQMFQLRINSRTLAPSEARAFYDEQPFTDAQLAEFDRLFGNPAAKAALPFGGN